MDIIFGEDKYIKNEPDIKYEAKNLSESLNINNRYKSYLDEIATNGIKESSPRSARELLKARKGEQNNQIKSFVKEYRKELIKKENEGREANNITR
jgi:hypothetical protein